MSQGHYEPAPFGSLPHEPPRAKWGVIISALVVVVVIVGAILWLFTGWDDEGDPVAVTAAAEETEAAAEETGAAAEAETAGAGEAPDNAPAGGETEAATASTAAAASTAADDPPTTAAAATTAPPDADDYGPAQLNAGSPVTTVGFGAVTFGLTVAGAQEAAGTAMIALEAESDCYRVVAHRGPEGVTFLVHEGTIERVDIDSGPVTTRSGVGIGTAESTITDLFGDKIQSQPRPDGSTDLVYVPVDPGDRNYRVVFNVVDGAVRSFKSGKIPVVLTDTGCEG